MTIRLLLIILFLTGNIMAGPGDKAVVVKPLWPIQLKHSRPPENPTSPTSPTSTTKPPLIHRVAPQGCDLDTKSMNYLDRQPLLLVKNSTEILSPSKEGKITIKVNSAIDLYCSARFVKLPNRKRITVKCNSKGKFNVMNKSYSFPELRCKNIVASWIKGTKERCFNNSLILKIGIQIKKHFESTITLCYDNIKEFTYYANYNITPSTNAYTPGVTRPRSLKGGQFFKRNIGKMYSQINQMEIFHKIIGGAYVEYFNTTKNLYLTHGKLASMIDFIYPPLQVATSNYVNMAPQWQTVNIGNWKQLDNDIRLFAMNNDYILEIYSGTWGILQLPDCNDILKDIYLDFDKKEGRIPVPKLFYRIIIESKTKKGIVVLVVNNPFAKIEDIKKNYILCNDISSQITWWKIKEQDCKKGYIYACEVERFAKVVKHLPPMTVDGLLV